MSDIAEAQSRIADAKSRAMLLAVGCDRLREINAELLAVCKELLPFARSGTLSGEAMGETVRPTAAVARAEAAIAKAEAST